MAWETFPHSYTSHQNHSWVFKTLWVIIFLVRVTCKMLNVNWEKIHSIILSVNRGGEVGHRGVCHGKFQLDNFYMIFWQIPHKPAWNLVKLICKYSYLILGQIDLMQCTINYEISIKISFILKAFHPALSAMMSSPVLPTLYVISVDHEGDQFESWKFYYVCNKGHWIHSLPQI